MGAGTTISSELKSDGGGIGLFSEPKQTSFMADPLSTYPQNAKRCMKKFSNTFSDLTVYMQESTHNNVYFTTNEKLYVAQCVAKTTH